MSDGLHNWSKDIEAIKTISHTDNVRHLRRTPSRPHGPRASPPLFVPCRAMPLCRFRFPGWISPGFPVVLSSSAPLSATTTSVGTERGIAAAAQWRWHWW